MVKKRNIILTLVLNLTLIWSTFAYDLNTNDFLISEVITQKINQVILKKWEKYRIKYIIALKKLKNKYNNERVSEIVYNIIERLTSKKEVISTAADIDLSTPEKAYKFCVIAFRDSDKNNLSKCLSEKLKKSLNKYADIYINSWNLCFTSCWWFDAKVIWTECFLKDWMKPVNCDLWDYAYVKFEKHEGCQSFLSISKETDWWKFDEK